MDVESKPGGSYLKNIELVEFQAWDVAMASSMGSRMLLWDTGLGKSVSGLALSKMSFEDQEIDHVLLVCERNKLNEWLCDFRDETDLEVRKHHGSTRWKQMERNGMPQVLVTTYETAKLDAVIKAGPRKLVSGELLRLLEGLRVLVVYDEVAKLRNRSSAVYKAHDHLLKTLRKTGSVKVVGLTATPIERGYEDVFNQLRLIIPGAVPNVTDWTKKCVRYRDRYDRPVYDTVQVKEFIDSVRPWIGIKHKTDPDVIDQFPAFTEEHRVIEMSAPHRDLYQAIESEVMEMPEEKAAAAFMTLRQVATCPGSLIYSAARENGSEFTKTIVDMVGEHHLFGLPNAKEDELIQLLRSVVLDEGHKAVVFTFFGASVLPYLEMTLTRPGVDLPVFTYHGGKTGAENEKAKERFQQAPAGAVLLGSDAASRGINLPQATHVIEYESALTHAQRMQRLNRVHRMRSNYGPVSALTMITAGTIEEPLFQNVLKRNEMHDILTDDGQMEEEYVSSDVRRAILQAAQERHARYKMKS